MSLRRQEGKNMILRREAATCFCAADGLVHRYVLLVVREGPPGYETELWRDGEYIPPRDQTLDERAARASYLQEVQL